ncbi:MAG: 4-alpha-glucanotransferase, partial [Proteobacteria bacterium]|nr:4-alpha-glucanotransferase [Pseudomonadota bacterium]
MSKELRRSGILLHPSSLHGNGGVGDIGPVAHEFLDFAQAAGQQIWQMLPLNPVDTFGCPYTSASAFAREPLLLSVDCLIRDGWLFDVEIPAGPAAGYVDWERMFAERLPILLLAASRVAAEVDLSAFCLEHEWVRNWGLFCAMRDELGPDWRTWPVPCRDRHALTLEQFESGNTASIMCHIALQWLFDQQWKELREAAAKRGIELWGDLPFHVGAASCDVWVNRHLFRLKPDGTPTLISGVPPDDFTPKGQLWGHAVFKNEAHREQDFDWWVSRARAVLSCFDAIRLDHFRGIEAAWEVPAGAEDARGGKWVPGLGKPLMLALKAAFPKMPFIAEDLGIITKEVELLRREFGLPGMAILQFGFGGGMDHSYLPHNIESDRVVYAGTHDNDTSLGWYQSANWETRDHIRRYLLVDGHDIAWDMIRCAMRAPAETAIVPLQDILSLDSSARMNVPGRAEGNWRWRASPGAFDPNLAAALA